MRAPLWLAMLALISVIAGSAALPTGAYPHPEAIVLGTAGNALRVCPESSCAVRGTIPPGGLVSIIGQAVDGFVPVGYEDNSGYVEQDFLFRIPPGGSPRFSAGMPGCGRVALIFNIGSGFEPATSIITTLKANDVPATMFVMGWWVDQNPDLVHRIDELGFPIGSHGHLPPELTARSDDDVAADLHAATMAIERAIGAPPGPWFTPFAGAIDDRVRAIALSLGYLPIGWEVNSGDWQPAATADAVYQEVIGNVYDGAIVELHLDASTSTWSTAVALPRIIEKLRAWGFRFVTIPELMQPCG